MWRSLVARSVRVGEVPSSNLGTPILSLALTGPNRVMSRTGFRRQGYASLLIANGLNVVFVSRQLGHANPNITLEVHAHLFASADHADTARDALEANHAATVSGA